MPILVAPNQVSFVIGRSIIANVLVIQEVIHSMRLDRRNPQWMAIKVDLEKAYDIIRWDFIEETLRYAGLPLQLISVIMNCITGSSMQISWNDEYTNEFRPSRGVRQGDPLSPYLLF